MNNVVQVFEQDKIKVSQVIDGYTITVLDFQKLVQWNERHNNKYLTVGYQSIRFKQYVGAILVNNTIFEILPKIDKHEKREKRLWRNVLIQMLSECNRIKLYESTKSMLNLEDSNILELYLRQFIDEVENLIHSGLIKKYRSIQYNANNLKGRIQFSRHVIHNSIHKERFFIEAVAYDFNNTMNRILKTALVTLSKTGLSNSSLSKRLNTVLFHFENIDSIGSSINWDSIVYDRKTTKYKNAIVLAKLIIENKNPDIAHGKNNILAFLFDMNKLFEEYIYIQCLKAAKKYNDCTVHYQRGKRFWKYKKIIPDIIVSFGGKNIILDAKWKRFSYESIDSDLKQIYTYSVYWAAKKSFLVYPAVESASSIIKENYKKNMLLEGFEPELNIIPVTLVNDQGVNRNIGSELIEMIV